PRLNLPAATTPAEVAAAVAARTGDGPGPTEELLYGGGPETDQDLLELARSLDRVTRTVAPYPADAPPSVAAPHPHRAEGDPR
ncbi:hypothetical protein NCC78_31700, partial [Micromonospora phytophila]|nr:hypothetical protein [Micromonospora phytophila]